MGDQIFAMSVVGTSVQCSHEHTVNIDARMDDEDVHAKRQMCATVDHDPLRVFVNPHFKGIREYLAYLMCVDTFVTILTIEYSNLSPN